MRFLLFLIITLIYIVLGAYCQSSKLMTEPAWFSFYGYCFGAFSIGVDLKLRGRK